MGETPRVNWTILSTVIAAAGLLIAVWHGCENVSHNKRTVEPKIKLSFRPANAEGAGFRIHNPQQGSGEIKVFEVFVDDKPEPGWPSMMRSLGLPSSALIREFWPTSGTVMPAESNVWMILVRPGHEAEFFENNRKRIQFKFCYCSIANECWEYTSRMPIGSERRRKVDECKLPDKVIFGSVKD